MCFNPHGEDLVTYLAGAREYLDLIVDQTEGGMRVVPGSNKYSTKANWKLLAENSLDGYHLVPTHWTYLEYIASLGTDDSGDTLAERPPGRSRALGNGHCVAENIARNGRPIAHWHPQFGEEAREPIALLRERLVKKYGEERAHLMADVSRNLLIYPNLVINDFVAITIRYFEPLAPDSMEVTAWHLTPKDESEAMMAIRLDSFLTFLGPGGFATPDDVEALESCQAGFRATELEWSDLSRGHVETRSGDVRRASDARLLASMARTHAGVEQGRRSGRANCGNGSRIGFGVRRPAGCPTGRTMTVNGGPTLRELVEDFLFREAELLDDWRLDDWVSLFTEDCRYVVPTTDLPEGDPTRDLVFIDDDIIRLKARAVRLNNRRAHREYPWSRTRRFVSNVRVEEAGDGQIKVASNVLVYRFRSGEGAPYVGSIEYILRREGRALKIAYRRAVLDLESLSWHGAVSIVF